MFISEVTISGVTTAISPPEQIITATNGIILNHDMRDAINSSAQIVSLLDSNLCALPRGAIGNQNACEHLIGQYNIFVASRRLEALKISDGAGVHIATANFVDTGGDY